MFRPAVLVIDMLIDFFKSPELSVLEEGLVRSTNEMTGFARANSYPVVWVRQEYQPDLSDAPIRMRDTNRRVTICGTEGCQLLPGLERSASDFEVVKKRYSAFFGTDLLQRLVKLRPTHLVICGINSHACVRSTAVDAYQRDYRLLFAEDCIASYDAEFHRESMRYFRHALGEVLSNQQLFAMRQV